MGQRRQLRQIDGTQLRTEFCGVLDELAKAIPPENLFRPGGKVINAAVFDAMTVGMARRLEQGEPPNAEAVRDAYLGLLEDAEFQFVYVRATADEASVARRIEMATEAFASI
jgi:hypothetical protein